MIRSKVKIRRESDEINIPEYKTEGASGFDIEASSDVIIHPGKTVIIRTGLRFEVPEGLELQIRPRSGISLKTNLRVILGTVDSDYRGDVGVIAENNGKETIFIKKGDRVAQGVICPVVRAIFEEDEDLTPTVRSESGFGSTGK